MPEKWPDIPGYTIEGEIGRGGMGVVYRAHRHADGRVLALKMILTGRGATFPEFVRFRIEAEALSCLDHPNVVKIREIGLHQGCPFFALDFAGHGSLKELISGRPQKPRWAAEMARTLALAMQHSHERGMLHRDLKPANVLLMEDDTPVISDFGLVKFSEPISKVSEEFCTMTGSSLLDIELERFAREFEVDYAVSATAAGMSDDEATLTAWDRCASRTGVLADSTRIESVRQFLHEARRQSVPMPSSLEGLTVHGSVMGSPNYMAPEQARGELQKIGPHTDVFALGGILYELLTARPPFRYADMMLMRARGIYTRPMTPREIHGDVSGDIEAVCMKCLSESPEQRYRNAAELAEDLTRFIDGYAPLAKLTQPHSPPPGGLSAWPEPAVTRDVSALATASIATKTWWPFRQTRPSPR